MRPATGFASGLKTLTSRSLLPRSAITTTSATTSRSFSHLVTRPLQRRPYPAPRPFTTPVRYQSDSSSDKPDSPSDKPGEIPIDLSPLTDRPSDAATDAETAEANRRRREQEPSYMIVFTCNPCGHRSAHRMSKHGYHRGTVVIRCPSCKNRHVMSDNLKIFFDKNQTVQDILAEKGQKITTGYVEGDMEFWDDGTVKKHEREGGGDGKQGSDSGSGSEGETPKLS